MTYLTLRGERNEPLFELKTDPGSALLVLELDRALRLSELRQWIKDKLMAGTRPVSRDHERVLVLLHQALVSPAGRVTLPNNWGSASWLDLLRELSA